MTNAGPPEARLEVDVFVVVARGDVTAILVGNAELELLVVPVLLVAAPPQAISCTAVKPMARF